MFNRIALFVVFVVSFIFVSPAFAGGDDNPCCAPAQRPRVVSTPKPSSPRVTKIYKMNGVDRYARSENKRQDEEIAKKANSEDVAKKFGEVDDRLAGHDTAISNLDKGLAAVEKSIQSALADVGWMKLFLAIVGVLALAAFIIALVALFRNRAAAATASASATATPAAGAPAPAPAGTGPVMNWDPTQLRVTAVEVVPPANQQPQQVSRPAFQQPAANRGRRASVVPSHDDDDKSV